MTKTKTSQITPQSLSDLTSNQARIRQLEAAWQLPPYYDVVLETDNGTSRVMATSSNELDVRKSYEGFLIAEWVGPKPIRMRLWMYIPKATAPTLLEEHVWDKVEPSPDSTNG